MNKFYSAGIENGAIDNGPAGLRKENYYAAYLIDPDGNNVEAGFRELPVPNNDSQSDTKNARLL